MNRHKKVPVTCKDCGKLYEKRADTICRWSGRCSGCSNKEVANRPPIKMAQSIRAKKQMLDLWKDPFYKKKMSKAHTGTHVGSKNGRWKGGIPKCLDCGKQLSSYRAKRCHPCYAKTIIGHKVSVKTRQKIRDAQKGAKSSNWKGGISKVRDRIYHSLEYRTWRNEVFQRDGYTCRHCNKKGGYLQPHHIKSFAEHPELVFVVSNGLSLCRKCHRKTDNFGFRQSNKNKKVTS